MGRSPWRCACDAVNPWTAAFCEACGLERPRRVSPVAAPSMLAVYREPVARPAYVEPTEAEASEIRIKLGETIDKLTRATTDRGRGMLHTRTNELREDPFPRFKTDAERQAEAQRQLEAFQAWLGGRRMSLLVLCLKGCGRLVPRNLDHDHGICGRCWEMTYGTERCA